MSDHVDDPAWITYLDGLAQDPRVGPTLAGHVTRVWAELRRRCGAELPIPMAGPSASEDGVFLLTWSYRTMTAEVDIHPDGTHAWYARDRITGLSEGLEGDEYEPSDVLIAWLRRVIDAQSPIPNPR